MINIVFEDADGTPVSELIRESLESSYTVHFAGGVSNIRHVIKSLPEDAVCVAFIDMVPDNGNSAKEYNLTRKALRKRSNTYLIPVICTEYYILKAFIYPEICNPICILTTVNYDTLDFRIKSLEHFYKYLLDMQEDCLTLGTFRNSPQSELFYKQDCNCKGCATMYSKGNKALKLVHSFPLSEFENIEAIESVILQQRTKYNDMLRALVDTGIMSEDTANKRYI